MQCFSSLMHYDYLVLVVLFVLLTFSGLITVILADL